MVMFGSIYFIMPRVLGREWPSAALISLHFWLVACGFAIYFVGLSIGGWLQGLTMLDAKQPFMASVAVTLPYLESRSLGGGLMTLGHLPFGTPFFLMMLRPETPEARATPFGFLNLITPAEGPS